MDDVRAIRSVEYKLSPTSFICCVQILQRFDFRVFFDQSSSFVCPKDEGGKHPQHNPNGRLQLVVVWWVLFDPTHHINLLTTPYTLALATHKVTAE